MQYIAAITNPGRYESIKKITPVIYLQSDFF